MRGSMSKQLIDHEKYVPALINFVGNKLATGASNAYRREFGIGVTEWRILSLLAIADTYSAQEICQFFDLDKGLVSRTTKSLVKNGIVRVVAQAGGVKRAIILTKAGRALHDRVIKLALKREKVLLACLSESETDVLLDLLRRLLDQAPAVNAVQSGHGQPASRRKEPT
jgi:DNA-binding MarR family transcriptional regulator